MPGQRIDHLVQPRRRHHHRLDRLPPRRHFVQLGHFHFAIIGQRQRAWDRRSRHHQQMRRLRSLVGQHHPLRHAEPMLFIDHRQPQRLILHLLLKYRVGADQYVDAAIGQPHQRRLAHLALVAPGQDGDLDWQTGRHLAQRLIMLPRQYLGRGQHRPLHPRLDRIEQRHQRHQRLA